MLEAARPRVPRRGARAWCGELHGVDVSFDYHLCYWRDAMMPQEDRSALGRMRAHARRVLSRSLLAAIASPAGLVTAIPLAGAQDANMCDQPGEVPDIVVGDLLGVKYYGTIGGISGYAIGTDVCNLGTCWANYNGTTSQHPVVAMNMFRLK